MTDHVNAEPTMIDVELFALKPGDEVLCVNDSGQTHKRIVKYSPWQLGGGTWVVGLKGISGGYALHRCRLPQGAR
jgi:hypothetical protein